MNDETRVAMEGAIADLPHDWRAAFLLRDVEGLSNTDAAAALERLWRDMRARGVELVVYAPPYHPAAWEALRRDPRYRGVLDSSAAALTRLAGAVGARFLDASDPAAIPCGEAEFYDMQHATPACLGRLWARLLPSSLVSAQLRLAPPAALVTNLAGE
jgi:hypothetical protein